MCYYQVPFAIDDFGGSGFCNKNAVAVENRKDVALNVPFRVATGAFLYVAGKSPVSFFPKRRAYRLAFFACNKNIHARLFIKLEKAHLVVNLKHLPGVVWRRGVSPVWNGLLRECVSRRRVQFWQRLRHKA